MKAILVASLVFASFAFGVVIGVKIERAYQENLRSVTKKIIERRIDDKKQELRQRSPIHKSQPNRGQTCARR